MKILAGFYTNNKVRQSLLAESLHHFELAAAQAAVIPVVSSWKPIPGHNCRSLISHFQIPAHGHLNILLQILQIVHSTTEPWDYFAFCEHDCLYPKNYFADNYRLLSSGEYSGMASENHIGLRPNGYAKCWYHTQPLFAMIVRREELLSSLELKLEECVLNGWCCIEPDDRTGWLIRSVDIQTPPIIHVNMETTNANHHLTNHHHFYSLTETIDELPYWGHYDRFSIFSEDEVDHLAKPVIDQATSRIIDAQYGDFSSNRTVSYMPALQNRRFSGIFQVCNTDAGSDPAPGVVKTLRLQVETGNESAVQMEFRENAVFRL